MRVLALLLVLAGGEPAEATRAIRARLDQARDRSNGAVADRVDRALSDQRPLLALQQLEPIWLRHEAERFVRQHARQRAAQPDALWREVAAQVEASQPDLRADLPAALRALADSAIARSRPTLNGSRPYATEVDRADGLYYLGEAQAYTRLAAFYADVPMAGTAPAPVFRSVAPELAAFERRVAWMHTGADAQSRAAFIPISTALTLTRQLIAEGRHAGAIQQYLTARYQTALLTTPPATADTVLPRIAAARTRLGAGDHSIAHLWLEMAAAHADAALPPGPRGAAAIVDDVLPAYLGLVESPGAESAIDTRPDAAVTITLVRWPFMCSLSDPVELLARDVAASVGGRVVVSIERYGTSAIAARHRVRQFPVVFVGDQLVAQPADFGLGDDGRTGEGRYVPWREPANQRRFREDLLAVVRRQLDRTAILAR